MKGLIVAKQEVLEKLKGDFEAASGLKMEMWQMNWVASARHIRNVPMALLLSALESLAETDFDKTNQDGCLKYLTGYINGAHHIVDMVGKGKKEKGT